MKQRISFLLIIVAGLAALSSCSHYHSEAYSRNASIAPNTVANSYNNYDLIVSDEMVEYTIDISTPEGRLKLNKISEKDARELALNEALLKYKCAMLMNPEYTFAKNGKKILRVTVFGFPAKYKNQEKQNVTRESGDNITINNNIQYNKSGNESGKKKRKN